MSAPNYDQALTVLGTGGVQNKWDQRFVTRINVDKLIQMVRNDYTSEMCYCIILYFLTILIKCIHYSHTYLFEGDK